MKRDNQTPAPRFPLFVSLEHKRVLIVGGGTIAVRRIRILLSFGADLLVISPELLPEGRELVEKGMLKWKKGRYLPGQVKDAFLVLACTDDADVNHAVCMDAGSAGCLCNNCSDPMDCDFYFPSIILQNSEVIGISGNGKDHRSVKNLRKEMEGWLHGKEADYDRNEGKSSCADSERIRKSLY